MPAVAPAPGVINRLMANLSFPDDNTLQITAHHLAEQGISLALEGESTNMLPAMMSLVASPAPYMKATLTIALLRSLTIASIYQRKLTTNTLLGDCIVTPDISDSNLDYLGTFRLINTALESIRELEFAGRQPGITIVVAGYYPTNTGFYGT